LIKHLHYHAIFIKNKLKIAQIYSKQIHRYTKALGTLYPQQSIQGFILWLENLAAMEMRG
jgi:hypothetical protein